MPVRRGTRLPAVLLSLALLGLGAGCGQSAEISADRPDVTAAPPPSGSDAPHPSARRHGKGGTEAGTKAHRKHKAAQVTTVSKRAPEPARGPTLPAGSTTATTVAPARWVSLRDAPSGIGFRLPAAVRHTTTALPLGDGSRLVTRLYTVQNRDADLEIVSFAAMPFGSSLDNRAALVDYAKRALDVAGGRSTLIDQRQLTVGGDQALDLAFRFAEGTPTTGLVLMRFVLMGDTLVTAQTYVSGTGASARRAVDTAHRALTSSLRR